MSKLEDWEAEAKQMQTNPQYPESADKDRLILLLDNVLRQKSLTILKLISIVREYERALMEIECATIRRKIENIPIPYRCFTCDGPDIAHEALQKGKEILGE